MPSTCGVASITNVNKHIACVLEEEAVANRGKRGVSLRKIAFVELYSRWNNLLGPSRK